jgi:GTP-binding protein
VLDVTADPADAYRTVRGEIAAFDAALAERPSLIALNKIDLIAPEEAKSAAKQLERELSIAVFPISAEKHGGIEPLVAKIAALLRAIDQDAA